MADYYSDVWMYHHLTLCSFVETYTLLLCPNPKWGHRDPPNPQHAPAGSSRLSSELGKAPGLQEAADTMPACFPGGGRTCGRGQGLLQRERLCPAKNKTETSRIHAKEWVTSGNRRNPGRWEAAHRSAQGPAGLLHPDGQVRLPAPRGSLRLFMTSLVETQATPR